MKISENYNLTIIFRILTGSAKHFFSVLLLSSFYRFTLSLFMM